MNDLAAARSLKSNPLKQDERREFPRYALGAPAEIRDPAAKTKSAGQVTVISKKGCYLRAPRRFQPSAVVQLHIQKGDTAFETWAKVIPNVPDAGEGMALLFMGTAPEQEELLKLWIEELSKRSR